MDLKYCTVNAHNVYSLLFIFEVFKLILETLREGPSSKYKPKSVNKKQFRNEQCEKNRSAVHL